MFGSRLLWRLVLVMALLSVIVVGCGGEAHGPDIEWKTAEVTPENVKVVLNQKTEVDPSCRDRGFPKSVTKIEVIDHALKPGQKNVHVYFKPTFGNDTYFVKQVGGTTIRAASILYENPKIEDVCFFALAEMIDQYANTKEEVALKLCFNREIAEKVDWRGLADRHLIDPGSIYRILEGKWYIHPGILKDVKRDEVNLGR